MLKAIITLFTCVIPAVTYSFDVEKFVSQMTIDEKIGQLFMVGSVVNETINADTIAGKKYRVDREYVTELIKKYKIGGILWYGSNTPPKSIATRAQEYQEINNQCGNKIPLWFCQDLEPNFMSRLGYTEFPSTAELGRKDKNIIEDIGDTIGKIARQCSINIVLAPVVDVNTNTTNPIIGSLSRSFGSNPELVAENAAAFITGLEKNNIIACIKHFPGHGDTNTDSHKGLPIVSHNRERLDSIELYPFRRLIEQGKASMIMSGHISMPAINGEISVPASISKKVITDLLIGELGHTGLIITDALDMQALFECAKPGKCELMALRAGNDILLSPTDLPQAVKLIKEAIESEILPMKELDQHVVKIIRAKSELFDI